MKPVLLPSCAALLALTLADYAAAQAQNAGALDLRNRVSAKVDAGDLDGALAECNRDIERNPKDSTPRLLRLQINLGRRDFDAVIADANELINLEPTSAVSYKLRGVALQNKGKLTEAIADFTKCISLDPQDGLAYLARGSVSYLQGELTAAISDCDRAILLDDHLPEAYACRALANRDRGKMEDALADFNRTIELQPNFDAIYLRRGEVQLLLHHADAALADFRKACAVDAHDQIYTRLAIWIARARLGQTDEANTELEAFRAGRAAGKPPDWPAMLADFLLGKTSEEKLLAAAATPQDGPSRTCQAFYLAGIKHLLAGNEKAASECFKKCVETGQTKQPELHLAAAELQLLIKKN